MAKMNELLPTTPKAQSQIYYSLFALYIGMIYNEDNKERLLRYGFECIGLRRK